MNPGLTTCKNCGNPFEGKFCNLCGQSADVKRFRVIHLLTTFLKSFIKLDSGHIYTVQQLFIQPGDMLRGYLSGKRVRYTNPTAYLIVVSAVTAYLITFSGLIDHAEDTFFNSANHLNFVVQHLSIRMFLAIPVYVLLGKIFYTSYNYNVAEHFVINAYIASQSTFLIGIWMIVLIIFRSLEIMYKIIPVCFLATMIFYQVMVFYQFFKSESSWQHWVKVISFVILGFVINMTMVRTLFHHDFPITSKYWEFIK